MSYDTFVKWVIRGLIGGILTLIVRVALALPGAETPTLLTLILMAIVFGSWSIADAIERLGEKMNRTAPKPAPVAPAVIATPNVIPAQPAPEAKTPGAWAFHAKN